MADDSMGEIYVKVDMKEMNNAINALKGLGTILNKITDNMSKSVKKQRMITSKEYKRIMDEFAKNVEHHNKSTEAMFNKIFKDVLAGRPDTPVTRKDQSAMISKHATAKDRRKTNRQRTNDALKAANERIDHIADRRDATQKQKTADKKDIIDLTADRRDAKQAQITADRLKVNLEKAVQTTARLTQEADNVQLKHDLKIQARGGTTQELQQQKFDHDTKSRALKQKNMEDNQAQELANWKEKQFLRGSRSSGGIMNFMKTLAKSDNSIGGAYKLSELKQKRMAGQKLNKDEQKTYQDLRSKGADKSRLMPLFRRFDRTFGTGSKWDKTFRGHGKAAAGAIGGAAVMGGVGIIKKGISLAIESSPMLQQMLKLWKFGIMMIFRPIGTFFGMIMRPIMILMLRKFIIPFYQKYMPEMMKLGNDIGIILTKVIDWITDFDIVKGVGDLVSSINFTIPDDDPLFGKDGAISKWAKELEDYEWDKIIPNFPDVFAEMDTTTLNDDWKKITDFWKGVNDDITNDVSGYFTKVHDFWKGIGTDITDNVTGYFTKVHDFWKGIGTDVTDNVSGYFTKVHDFWKGIGTDITDNVSGYFTKVHNFWKGVSDDSSGWVKDRWDDVTSFFANISANVTNWIDDKWDDLTGFFNDLSTSVTSTLEPVWKTFTGWWESISSWLSSIGINIGSGNGNSGNSNVSNQKGSASNPWTSADKSEYGGLESWLVMRGGHIADINQDNYFSDKEANDWNSTPAYSNLQIPTGHIKLAEGGIINEPISGLGLSSGKSYLMGESGSEAVVPLNKLNNNGNSITINIQNMSGSQNDLYNLKKTILDVLQESSSGRLRA